MPTQVKQRFRRQAERTAQEQRRIQREVEEYQANGGKAGQEGSDNGCADPPSAAARYALVGTAPGRPGMESQLNPQPRTASLRELRNQRHILPVMDGQTGSE